MRRKRSAYLLAAMLLLGGVALAEESNRLDEVISHMTIAEKVSQLFFVRPEDFSRISSVSKPSKRLEAAFSRFPVGGVVLFPDNMKNAKQLTTLNEAMQNYAKGVNGIGLFIGVDEEGGGVARVAKKLKHKNPEPSMSEIGRTGDDERAYQAGKHIGQYLHEYGFTLDFAPVADVRMKVEKPEITLRSFGETPELVSSMVVRFAEGLQENGVLAVLKHFPGHGGASGNSHNGRAVSERSISQWREWEWQPFQAGMDAGVRIVMISHQTAALVDHENPASLSHVIVTELLRGELGFDGVVITDGLRMKAVSDQYGSGEACVRALEAGCDMLLLPKNFTNGFNGVMQALEEGRLTEKRIDESLRRILTLKDEWGLLKQ